MDLTLFDILNNISKENKDLSGEEEFAKQYNPFMINRFLSMSADTLFFANFMNRCSNLPKELQYQFYLKGLSKKKRFFKYVKKEKEANADVAIVAKYYDISKEKSIELLDILNKEQIDNIKSTYEDGAQKKGS